MNRNPLSLEYLSKLAVLQNKNSDISILANKMIHEIRNDTPNYLLNKHPYFLKDNQYNSNIDQYDYKYWKIPVMQYFILWSKSIELNNINDILYYTKCIKNLTCNDFKNVKELNINIHHNECENDNLPCNKGFHYLTYYLILIWKTENNIYLEYLIIFLKNNNMNSTIDSIMFFIIELHNKLPTLFM